MTKLDPIQRAPQGSFNLQRKLLAATVAACFGVAQANPTLPQVVAGQAAFSQQGNVFSITNTPNTIINWQSFNIGRDEITRFIQQSSDSKVLNRITGQDPSQILGSLQSNGQVFLINPNGVLFGKDARIDVQGLVASSLNISNSDFLAGKHNFQGEGAGKVVNQGSISTPQGGKVFLIAPTVENHGVISAPNGEVLLAAGKSVQLVDSANPAITVVVSAPEDQALNLGQIVAQGGRIGIYGALVNQRGTVNADSAVRGENGKIVLKASRRSTLEAGSLTSAKGAGKGGEIQVLGETVVLNGNAAVDASGQQGGGTVLVGGDYQGKNAAVQNAKRTFVSSKASVKADALASGDGGKIIVWADESAQAYGSISARSAGGKGGFVETSGHYLDVAGLRVDTTGRDATGVWLLDPYNIEVVAGYGDAGSYGTYTFESGDPAPAISHIGVDYLNGSNTNVVMQAINDITFTAAVNMSQAGVGLTAQAGNNITVSATSGITTNNGAVVLSAGDTASSAPVATGAVNVAAGINTGGGKVTLKGAGITVGANINSGAGDIELRAKAGGTINVLEDKTLTAAAIDASPTAPVPTISLLADNILLDGSIVNTANGGGYVSIAPTTAGRGITLGASGAGTLSLSNDQLDNIHAYSTSIGSAGAGAITVGGNLTLNDTHLLLQSAGNINVNANIGVGSKNLYLSAVGSGAVSQQTSASIVAGTLVASGSSVSLGGANDVNNLAGRSSTGAFSFRDTDDLALVSAGGLSGVQANTSLSLNAASLSQSGGKVQADTLNLTGSDAFSLNQSDNKVNKLNANVGNLLYYGAGSTTLQSVTRTGTSGNIYVDLVDSGSTLTVNQINAIGGELTLKGDNVTVASGGQAVGGSVHVWAGQQLTLNGALKGQYSDRKGYVTLHSDNNVYLGTLTAVEGGLSISNAALGKIDASSIFVSVNGYGGQLHVGGVTAPTGTYLGLESSDLLDIAGTVNAAGGLSLRADEYSFGSSAAIAAGTNVVNIGTSASHGKVKLGGGITTGFTYLDPVMLDKITSGNVFIEGTNGVTVGGAVNRGTKSLGLLSSLGTITVNAPITAGSVTIQANSMDINDTITASSAFIAPLTAGTKYSMVVGGDCEVALIASCLAFKDLSHLAVTSVSLGSDYNTSQLTVAGIGGSGDTARHSAINQINLGGENISQTGAIDVNTLRVNSSGNVVLDHAANSLTNFAVDSYLIDTTLFRPDNVTVRNAGALNVFQANVAETLSINAGGAISAGTQLVADKLVLRANGAVANGSGALQTKVNILDVETSGSSGNSINIVNNTATARNSLQIDRLVVGSGDGSITLSNYGATTVGNTESTGNLVSTVSGNISLKANSPLSVYGGVQSGTGNIALEAGSTGSSSDKLTVRNITTGGSVSLRAGDAVLQTGTIAATGGLTVNANTNPVAPPPVNPPPVNPPPTNPPPTNPPPTNPPPTNPPPTNPPPVDPPPTNPPPVNPPPVNPPPVNPPPVDPPPVNPPPVNPPPVNPPPVPSSADQCKLNPTLPACVVIAPPSVNEPVKPVQRATQEVIKTVNAATTEQPGSNAGSSGGDKGKSGGTGGPAATDDKKEEKKSDKSETATNDTGTKNEKPAAKSYCN